MGTETIVRAFTPSVATTVLEELRLSREAIGLQGGPLPPQVAVLAQLEELERQGETIRASIQRASGGERPTWASALTWCAQRGSKFALARAHDMDVVLNQMVCALHDLDLDPELLARTARQRLEDAIEQATERGLRPEDQREVARDQLCWLVRAIEDAAR